MAWAAAIVVLILALMGSAMAVRVGFSQPRSVTVIGQGIVSMGANADRTLNISLEARDASAAKVVAELDRGQTQVERILAAQKVPASDVHTQTFSVTKPSYMELQKLALVRQPSGLKLNNSYVQSYTASEGILVDHLSSAQVQRLAQAVLITGVVNNVNTYGGNPQQATAAVRAQAQEAALANARIQAQTLAKNAGASLGRILQFGPPPTPHITMEPMGQNVQPAVAYNTPVAGELTATVQVTFALR